MASNKKKQDDKYIKILRDLASIPGNKQCFDCSQRGPTYVNTTIGSFVCTKCSGMLRGLTPPHRVKSISMATFTPEEVESLKSKGNDYCRKVWLGLYDANHSQDTRDEQHIQDFMIAKYEKKRYYKEPTPGLKNGSSSGADEILVFPRSVESHVRPRNGPTMKVVESDVVAWPKTESWTQPRVAVPATHAPLPPPVKPPPIQAPNMSLTATTNMFTPDRTDTFKFPPVGDPFGGAPASMPSGAQASFANFDDNPIFHTPPALPASASFPSGLRSQRPPTEDKYAALKDLDSMMKMQNEPTSAVQSDISDWANSSNGSNPFTAFRMGTAGSSPVMGSSPTNPFRSGIDLAGTNTGNSAWNSIAPSHSMPFPVSWNSPNDLTVGPSKSSNPFL